MNNQYFARLASKPVKCKLSSQQDDRVDVDFNNVFIKLDIKERSFLLNTNDVKIFINKQSQIIKKIDVFIDLTSLIKQDNQIKKIIINFIIYQLKELMMKLILNFLTFLWI